MDLKRLKQVDEYRWSVPLKDAEERAPVLLYGTAELLQGMDEKVLEQVTNVAHLPGIVGSAMVMPDGHWGYGFPIGGVAAFDPRRGGIVSAGGVGFDISCGIRCLRTNLTWQQLGPKVEALAEALFRTIPAGVGSEGKLRLPPDELDEVLTGGAVWAVEHGYGSREDLDFIEDHGSVPGAKPECVSLLAKERQKGEMGTLGSGNHYLEVQVVERVHDAPAAEAFGLFQGQVLVSIHCGSRGLGHQVGTDYLVSLAKAAQRLGIKLPERELACAPLESPEGQQYLGAMTAAINCALANRQILTHLTRSAFARIVPEAALDTLFDVSHNTCKYETHVVDGKAQQVYVHRKGATRAFGPGHPALPEKYRASGQPVIIGGSMGTGSYILAGMDESRNQAFASASHGAGRAMSRTQALKRWRGEKLIKELKDEGIIIRTHSFKGAAEEAPGAYKDVDVVVEATEKAGLAKRVVHMAPKACIKG